MKSKKAKSKKNASGDKNKGNNDGNNSMNCRHHDQAIKDVLVLIGDSDIDYWPLELVPSIKSCRRRQRRRREGHGAGGDYDNDENDGTYNDNSNSSSSSENDDDDSSSHSSNIVVVKRGKSGATLNEIIPELKVVFEEQRRERQQDSQDQHQRHIIVACAGENDIANGLSLDSSTTALEDFLDIILEESNNQCDNINSNEYHVIFLGPKFEPWLDDDGCSSYKKLYGKMSRNFERICTNHPMNQNQNNTATTTDTTTRTSIHYIDCITMFCTKETCNMPGAILGGKAKANYKYFQSDKLHLSQYGYKIWKKTIEDTIVYSM